MTKSRSGKILIIDTNVLVYLLDTLYTVDQFAFSKVIQYLLLSYSRIWIPGEVKHEFLFKRNDKRRARQINKIYEQYSSFSDCPIKVGAHEINLLVGIREEDRGEADAILQIQKAKAQEKMFFEDIVFLSNDNDALTLAVNRAVSVMPYKDLKSSIGETGIILP